MPTPTRAMPCVPRVCDGCCTQLYTHALPCRSRLVHPRLLRPLAAYSEVLSHGCSRCFPAPPKLCPLHPPSLTSTWFPLPDPQSAAWCPWPPAFRSSCSSRTWTSAATRGWGWGQVWGRGQVWGQGWRGWGRRPRLGARGRRGRLAGVRRAGARGRRDRGVARCWTWRCGGGRCWAAAACGCSTCRASVGAC